MMTRFRDASPALFVALVQLKEDMAKAALVPGEKLGHSGLAWSG